MKEYYGVPESLTIENPPAGTGPVPLRIIPLVGGGSANFCGSCGSRITDPDAAACPICGRGILGRGGSYQKAVCITAWDARGVI